jgi:hypothetical protein
LWRWQVLHGAAWTPSAYAALILCTDEASPRAQAYAQGLRRAGVAGVANGFIVGVTCGTAEPATAGASASSLAASVDLTVASAAFDSAAFAASLDRPGAAAATAGSLAVAASGDLFGDAVALVHPELWLAVTKPDAQGRRARQAVAQACVVP